MHPDASVEVQRGHAPVFTDVVNAIRRHRTGQLMFVTWERHLGEMRWTARPMGGFPGSEHIGAYDTHDITEVAALVLCNTRVKDHDLLRQQIAALR